jgi:hypothetical protein
MDEPPLQVLPSLAERIGLNKAVFIQQVHYWLQKPGAHVRDGRKWIYNTYEQWAEQFPFWSEQTLRKRIVTPLEEAGILVTTSAYNANKSDKTKWYTIDYGVLSQTLNPLDKTTSPTGQNDHIRTGQNNHMVNQRLPETTNRDSVLQTGDGAKNGSAPEEEVKPKELGQFYVGELMDRIKARREKGIHVHSPTDRERRDFGAMFKQANADGHDLGDMIVAIEYQVAKAAGEIEGEPKAYPGYRTALDKVVLEGWRPTYVKEEDLHEAINRAQENENELADLLTLVEEE